MSSVLPPETTRGGGRAARWRLLARPQDPRVWGTACLLNSTSGVFTCWGTCREQRLEKGPFLRRPVLSVTWCSGSTAPLLAETWCGGGSRTWGGQLGLDGLRLGQGLCFPPQVSFYKHQAILELHKDLVLRRSQLTGLEKTTEGEVKVKVGGWVKEERKVRQNETLEHAFAQ